MFGKHMRKHSIKKGQNPKMRGRSNSKDKKERFENLVNAEIFKSE